MEPQLNECSTAAAAASLAHYYLSLTHITVSGKRQAGRTISYSVTTRKLCHDASSVPQCHQCVTYMSFPV